jgi:hypothetical protein
MATPKRTQGPANPKMAPTNKTAPAAVAPSVEAVAIRAYQIWTESGCAHGDDQAHWFRAELELRTGAARGR